MKRPTWESGYVLVVLAFILVILLGFAGMAVDVGVLYSSHTAAQRAADAAALAGAFTFITSPGATNPVALATDRALNTAMENQILGQNVQSSEVNINVDYPMRRVTVDVTRAQYTFFAKALFFGAAAIHAQGIAEASQSATGAKCVKPWFVPNSILASPGVNACGACADPANNLVVFPGSNLRNDAFVIANRGRQFTLKAGNPTGTISPGQFYAIDILDQNTGASVYREAIAGCLSDMTLYCLGTYTTKTGNMIGPTAQGVTGGANLTGRLLNLPSPDTWAGFVNNVAMFYLNGTSVMVDTSVQMVVAPLWDVCTPSLDCSNPNNPQFPSGTNAQIPVVGFALIFVEGMSGNDVVARLLDVQDCGTSPPTSTETGPFSIPLRLVRVN